MLVRRRRRRPGPDQILAPPLVVATPVHIAIIRDPAPRRWVAGGHAGVTVLAGPPATGLSYAAKRWFRGLDRRYR